MTNVLTGEQMPLSPINWSWIGQVNWLKDGSGILLLAFTAKSSNLTDEIWLVSYPDGQARLISSGVSGLYGFGVSDDTRSLVTARIEHASSLLVTAPNKLDESFVINKKIGDNSLANLGMTTTNDGKIIYSSSQQGNNADIWMVNEDGTNLKQLTDDSAADFSPTISADGNQLVFISNRTGAKNIWRMNIDGTNLKQLTNFQNVFSPSLSPDGHWVYFSATKSEITPPLLYQVSIEGGEPTQITNLNTLFPQISIDGKHLACLFPAITDDGKPTNSIKLTILSAPDGKLVKQFNLSSTYNENISLSWTPDGKSISYSVKQNGVSNIWAQPITGSQPTKITNSQSDEIFRYAWLKNSQKLVMEKGIVIKEISLIRDTTK